jgi:hypothetical protein
LRLGLTGAQACLLKAGRRSLLRRIHAKQWLPLGDLIALFDEDVGHAA